MTHPAIRLGVSAVSVVLVGLLLAFFQSTTPRYAKLTGPIVTTGAQAQTVASTTFSIKVTKVERARTVAYKRFGRSTERQTQGIWVIVSSELRSMQETMQVREAAIRGASGRLYRQSRRVGDAPQQVVEKFLQPGLPTTGIFIFELPEQETSDMTLVVSRQLGPQLDDEIGVTLDQNGIVTRDRLEIANGNG